MVGGGKEKKDGGGVGEKKEGGKRVKKRWEGEQGCVRG